MSLSDTATVGFPQLSDRSWSTLSTDQEWQEESEQALRELYKSMPFVFSEDDNREGFDDEDYNYPK